MMDLFIYIQSFIHPSIDVVIRYAKGGQGRPSGIIVNTTVLLSMRVLSKEYLVLKTYGTVLRKRSQYKDWMISSVSTECHGSRLNVQYSLACLIRHRTTNQEKQTKMVAPLIHAIISLLNSIAHG